MSLIRTDTSLPLRHASHHLLLRSLVHCLGWNGALKTKPAENSIPNPAFRRPNQQHPLQLHHPLKHGQQEEAKLERHRLEWDIRRSVIVIVTVINVNLTMPIDKVINIESCFQFFPSWSLWWIQKENETTESYCYLRAYLKLQIVLKIGAEVHPPW